MHKIKFGVEFQQTEINLKINQKSFKAFKKIIIKNYKKISLNTNKWNFFRLTLSYI